MFLSRMVPGMATKVEHISGDGSRSSFVAIHGAFRSPRHVGHTQPIVEGPRYELTRVGINRVLHLDIQGLELSGDIRGDVAAPIIVWLNLGRACSSQAIPD